MKTDKRVIILMYHMVSETDNAIEKRYAVKPVLFQRQMKFLKKRGYTPITLDIVHNFLAGDSELPERPVVITFDDGYMDNYENALPILHEFGFPAAVFIVSGYVGKTNLWDMKNGFQEKKLMGWREIEVMRRHGVTIGSHTINHCRLTELGLEEAKRELQDSKRHIEDNIGALVDHFAYPHGDMNEEVVKMVREAGYKTACSTRSGYNSNIELYGLRRIGIYGTDSLLYFAIKLVYGTNNGRISLPARYYINRLAEKAKGWI